MVATQCISACRHVKNKYQNGENKWCKFILIWHVFAPERLVYICFLSNQPYLSFTEDGQKERRKYPASGSSLSAQHT